MTGKEDAGRQSQIRINRDLVMERMDVKNKGEERLQSHEPVA